MADALCCCQLRWRRYYLQWASGFYRRSVGKVCWIFSSCRFCTEVLRLVLWKLCSTTSLGKEPDKILQRILISEDINNEVDKKKCGNSLGFVVIKIETWETLLRRNMSCRQPIAHQLVCADYLKSTTENTRKQDKKYRFGTCLKV